MTEEFVGTWHLCPAGFYFEELCPDSGFLLTKFLSCMRHAEQNCKMWWRLWWDVVRLPLHIAPGDPAGSSDRQKPKQLKGCLRWLGGVKMSQVSTVPLTWEVFGLLARTHRHFTVFCGRMDQGNEAHLQISCSKATVSRTSNKCGVLSWCSSYIGGDVFDCLFKFQRESI